MSKLIFNRSFLCLKYFTWGSNSNILPGDSNYMAKSSHDSLNTIHLYKNVILAIKGYFYGRLCYHSIYRIIHSEKCEMNVDNLSDPCEGALKRLTRNKSPQKL